MIVNSKVNYLIIASFLILSNLSFSQNIEFKNSNFKDDKQSLKLAQNNIFIADKIRNSGISKILRFQDGSVIFNKAIHVYKKAQNFNPNSAKLNYKIGSCLLFTNNKSKAYDYLQRAKDLTSNLPEDFFFFYAISLQLKGEFELAIEYFKKFELSTKKKIFEPFEVLVKKHIKECSIAKDVISKVNRIWIDNLSINTDYDDWSPCLSMDGDLLIFTSNKPVIDNADEYGIFDQNIYFSNLKNRKFNNASPILELNTSQDDVSGGLSYDGQRLLIFKEDSGNTDVFESKLNGLNWGEPHRKMGQKLKGGNTNGNETFASFDPPDVKVYYITDVAYGGNKNIYFSGIMNKERDLWGKGKSAGQAINTKFQEGSVFIHPDAKTMYFSSQGHNSIGGFDIFVSYVDELGHWGEPINLGFPINTVYDDLFYSSSASGKYAYISSNRPGGKGGMDIYKITYRGSDKPMNVDFHDQLISSIAMPQSDNIIVEQPILVEEKSLTVFKGKIIDAITFEPIKAEIEIVLNKTGDTYTTFYSNSATGKFLLSLPAGANYGISVTADGYLFHSENFDLPNGDGFKIVEKDIHLKNIKVGSNISLRNVFFDTGKWAIKSNSYNELDRLVILLNDVKTLKIEISGHTDNIGSLSFNELLSQKRADAVVDYLLSKGISKNRLSSRGYGQTKPISNNDTDNGRALNRRTEFEIIKN